MTEVAVIGTGGTIASTTAPDRDIAFPDLTPEDLLGRLDLPSVSVRPIDLFHMGSNTLQVEHVLKVAEAIRNQFDDGVDAVVVTQGTATLGETSYLYDLLLGPCPPVVCTGAMKPVSDLTPDGPANLRDSILFASASVNNRRGVYALIDGGVHAPADILKVNAATAAGFVSPGVGVLGWVDAGEVRIRRERKVRTTTFPGLDRNVELITAVFDATPVLVECVANSPSVHGVVVAGFPGRGAVPPDWMDPLTRFAATGRPFLFTSAALTGRVVAKHGAQATARHLQDIGAVICGDLAPPKARCLLMAALALTQDVDEIRDLIAKELASL